ncbi:MAG: DUF1015 family protein [Acidimicrobiales bacterium]
MATVEPLGLRLVTAEFADRVPSPAHDSLTPEGRRLALEANPESYLAVTRSLEDLDPSVAMSNDELLALGRRSLDRLIALGAFDGGHAPRFFAYRLATDTHCQTGLVGGVATADFAQGVVRAHEQIHHARSTHLARHLAVVGVQSSPIAVAHRPIPELRAYLDQATEQKPAHTIASEPGFTQTIWPIDATASPAITDLLRPTPLYLIDGHHRGAAAVEYRRLAGPGNATRPCACSSPPTNSPTMRSTGCYRRPSERRPRSRQWGGGRCSPHRRRRRPAPSRRSAYVRRLRRGAGGAIPAPSASGVAPALADLPPTRLAARFDEVFERSPATTSAVTDGATRCSTGPVCCRCRSCWTRPTITAAHSSCCHRSASTISSPSPMPGWPCRRSRPTSIRRFARGSSSAICDPIATHRASSGRLSGASDQANPRCRTLPDCCRAARSSNSGRVIGGC